MKGDKVKFMDSINKKGFHYELCETLDLPWAHLGLNQGPPDYESGALTN